MSFLALQGPSNNAIRTNDRSTVKSKVKLTQLSRISNFYFPLLASEHKNYLIIAFWPSGNEYFATVSLNLIFYNYEKYPSPFFMWMEIFSRAFHWT